MDPDLEWRPLTEKDIPAWAALHRAVVEAGLDDEHLSEEDLAEEFADPLFDPQRGSLAGFDGSSLVALGTLRVGSVLDSIHRMGYTGLVHPAHRGSGLETRLLTWAPDAARPLHEARFPGVTLVLNTGHLSTDTEAAKLFTRHGYQPNRYFHGMWRELDEQLPPIPETQGINITPYSPELDEQARWVKNESFKDHWGSAPRTPEQWRYEFTQSVSFRPDLSFLAQDAADGSAIGVIITKYYEANTAATGRREAHVSIVGTLRAARGRGVATALLGTVLHAARAAGFDSASLTVDAQNSTGALGVYERAGLTVRTIWISYSQRL